MQGTTQPIGVAGVFYPPDADACARMVDEHLARASPPACIAPKAVIAPHAGFVYSGPIQATAYAPLRARRGEITRVVILAPAHRVAFKGLAISPAEQWESPLGALAVDWPHLSRILSLPGVAVNAGPFTQEHAIEVQLPFIRRALGEVAICPVLVGAAATDLVAAALRALWGGPETAIVISSDLSHYHDDAGARQRDAAAAEAIELLKLDGLSSELACGHRAIAGLLAEAQARDLRATSLDLRNSSATMGKPERVVGYGAFAFEPAHGARIDVASRSTLVDLARRSIAIGLERKAAPAIVTDRATVPLLAARRATFVTLNLDGRLRGCIGSLQPHRALASDVATNAFKAAFADPRFKPLSAEELVRLVIHVSILSHARPIAAGSEAELVRALHPDVDGLIIRDGGRQAIFLPSVWSSIPEPLRFLRQLKRKAGLAPEHWSADFRAWRYMTEAF
ncbi:MAG: AmmeMemoRadiSam system protein B [Alphaproteobacteria bacterium]|nr:AmmeMemoRadiSam system protein B [Alphaproteobacteria bacterium]